MDREAYVKGLSDDYKLFLGYGVDIVCAVMKLPQCEKIDGIDYAAEVSGKELIAFIEKHARDQIFHISEIQEDKRYLITANDW